MRDSKAVIGSSIIYNWYEDVETLIQGYAEYSTALIKASKQESEDSETEQIEQYSNFIRKQFIKVHMRSKSILTSLGKGKSKVMEESYKKIKEQYIIKGDTIENYIQELQNLMLDDTISQIINNSEQIIQNVFSEQRDTNNNSSGSNL